MVVDVKGLRKCFRTKEKDAGLRGSIRAVLRPVYRTVQAVQGISFHVEKGEILAFVGPNGAGKSTTIKMLTGILHPSDGMAWVLGRVPWQARYELSFHIGSVFGQKSQLWYHLPPADSFALLARIYELDYGQYVHRRAMLVDAFAIADLMGTPVRRLSLGQRMRCEIAGAMLHKPEILFLDEPTIGLDIVARQNIRDLIKWMNAEEETTVFLTSHDTGDIESLCKRVMVINRGAIILDDSVSTLRRDYLRQKIVDIKLGIEVKGFQYPGTVMLKQKGGGIKLLVNTDQVEIKQVLEHIVQQYPVVDVNIGDPPLEDVISQIYREARTDAAGVVP